MELWMLKLICLCWPIGDFSRETLPRIQSSCFFKYDGVLDLSVIKRLYSLVQIRCFIWIAIKYSLMPRERASAPSAPWLPLLLLALRPSMHAPPIPGIEWGARTPVILKFNSREKYFKIPKFSDKKDRKVKKKEKKNKSIDWEAIFLWYCTSHYDVIIQHVCLHRKIEPPGKSCLKWQIHVNFTMIVSDFGTMVTSPFTMYVCA